MGSFFFFSFCLDVRTWNCWWSDREELDECVDEREREVDVDVVEEDCEGSVDADRV